MNKVNCDGRDTPATPGCGRSQRQVLRSKPFSLSQPTEREVSVAYMIRYLKKKKHFNNVIYKKAYTELYTFGEWIVWCVDYISI